MKKIAFDKTGTLTYGTPKVVLVHSALPSLSDNELYRLCAAAERYSEHPLGKAITRCCQQETGEALGEAENFQMVPGRGVSACVDGKTLLAGNAELLAEHHIAIPEEAAKAAVVQPSQGCTVTCAAVDGVFWLITGSNADAGGQVCTAMMQTFAAAHPDRAGFVQSLGLRRYLSAMNCAALVAGNSSSGVVETPTFKVPTVNIGRRQAGRAICANVLCSDADEPTIEAALRRALSPAFAPVAAGAVSPYNGGETSEKICAVLAKFDFARPKIFYDGPVPEFDPQRSVLV